MAEGRNESTRTFPVQTEKEQEMHYVLRTVYEALIEKGYNPINQIVGYILSLPTLPTIRTPAVLSAASTEMSFSMRWSRPISGAESTADGIF